MALFAVTSPALNDHWLRGNSYVIEWTGGDPGTYPTVDLMLYKGTATVSYIGSVDHTVGSKSWAITSSIATGTDYRVFASEGIIE